MSRKFTTADRETFKTVYLEFAWMPTAHLAGLMRVMADDSVGALPAKWQDFHVATAHRWITAGNWEDEVQQVREMIAAGTAPLPSDDEIDDLVMRRNLVVFDTISRRMAGGVGDFRHNARLYVDMQREIRTHVQVRRALPLTPSQLIDLFVQAGVYAGGAAFNVVMAKDWLQAKLRELRQVSPALLLEPAGLAS